MNKRLILSGLAVILLAGSTSAWAQVGGGIKAGLNLSSIKGFNDPGTTTSQRTGLTAGIFFTVGMAPFLAIEPEVLFSMQGTKLHFTSGSVKTDATTKLDYLQVPVLLRIGNSGGNAASLYGIVGPTVGLLLSANRDGVDIKDQMKKAQVGVVAGVGVTLTRFLAEARYTYDLTDFNKASTGANQRNRVISLLIGLVF